MAKKTHHLNFTSPLLGFANLRVKSQYYRCLTISLDTSTWAVLFELRLAETFFDMPVSVFRLARQCQTDTFRATGRYFIPEFQLKSIQPPTA